MPYLRALAFVAAMAAAFLVLVPVQALARRRGWAIQHAIQTSFCRIICATIGIRVETLGALPAAAPRFVVSNHVSWTDIVALASVAPLVFLAKSEVASWPVLGFLARLQGTVFVPRGSRKDIARVNEELSAALRIKAPWHTDAPEKSILHVPGKKPAQVALIGGYFIQYLFRYDHARCFPCCFDCSRYSPNCCRML